MEKVFFRFAIYIVTKWICFYAYEFNTSVGSWQAPNLEGLFLAAFMLFAWPLLELIVLWLPVHFALKQRGITQILILLSAFVLEFGLSWYMTNQKFATWMLVKLALSIVLFTLVYRKQMRLFAF